MPSKTKKTQKKATGAKKPAAKKASARLALVWAAPEQCFWVNYGPIVQNVKELRDALRQMTEDTFRHHVNEYKNDFVPWIRDALRDAELAKALENHKTKKGFLAVVERHLKKYSVA